MEDNNSEPKKKTVAELYESQASKMHEEELKNIGYTKAPIAELYESEASKLLDEGVLNDALQKENEELKKENEALKMVIGKDFVAVKETMDKLTEFSEKMTKVAQLLVNGHFTKEEKMVIAKEIDNANTLAKVELIYRRYMNILDPDGLEEDKTRLWSAGFARDINNMFIKFQGHDQFQAIEQAASIIREHFKIEEKLRIADNDQDKSELQAMWANKWEMASGAADEIFAIINQIKNR